MSENILNECPYIGNLPGTLVTHYKGDRIDIELDSYLPDHDGWMYVYDAGNDNDFNGPEDQLFLYKTKRRPEGTCFWTKEERTDLKQDADRYAGRIEMEKMRIVRWFVREFLNTSSKKNLPPQTGSHFLGNWREFVRDSKGAVGFRAHSFDWFCVGQNGERRKVQPDLIIDEKSYPEGMRVLRKANQIAHRLFDAARHDVILRSAIKFDTDLCRAYGRRCDVLEKHPLWVSLDEYISLITNPCKIEGNLDHFPRLVDGLENFANALDGGERRGKIYEEFAPADEQFQFPNRGIMAEEYAERFVNECNIKDLALKLPESQAL